MQRLVQWLGGRGVQMLAAGVFAGLAFPPAASWLRPTLPAVVALLLFLALIRVEWSELKHRLLRPGLATVATAWVLVLSPLAAALLVGALGVPAALATPLVLMSAAPPIMSSPAMAMLLGLDAALMLPVLIVTTLAAPFTLPWLAGVALELPLVIDPWQLFVRLAALIGGCTLAALIVRRAAGTGRIMSRARELDALAVAAMLVFAVAIMDGITARLAAEPWYVLGFVAAAFAANLLLQAATALVHWPAGSRAAATLAFAGGNRNMGLLLAVLPAGAELDTVMYFAVAQLPIYILPALLAPLYRRLARVPRRG